MHSYSLRKNESTELRYIVSNLGDVEIASQEWTAARPDGSDVSDALSVEDNMVKGLKSGDYYLTLTLTDTQGEKYSAKCIVLVDSNGSGVDVLISDMDVCKTNQDRIFNFQGIYVGDDTQDLSSGIYLRTTNGKTQKIQIK